MRRRILFSCLVAVVALSTRSVRAQNPVNIRIGLTQNAATVSIRSADDFTIQQNRTRTARFSMVLTVDPSASNRVLTRNDLQYRALVEIDGGRILVLPSTPRVRIEPRNNALIEFDNRAYRGAIEVFANQRNSFTVVNELPLEDYLSGVVPNELSPTTYGEIEALKAQAVAARTNAVRNLGQSKSEGYDRCASDTCQVYLGAGSEHPLSTQAVVETRGVIATYKDEPINALYSSTCGGSTEDAENIFDEKLPYLVSTICEYKHPEPLPFSTSRSFPDWKDAVLAVAGVSNFSEAQHFMGLPIRGEPPPTDLAGLSTFIRQSFFPAVLTDSDLSFLTEQGILSPTGNMPDKDILFRLIDKKSGFEWQQGILVSWDGTTMRLLVNGQPKVFHLSPDAPIYQRIGDERLGMRQGSWIGGELVDFRADSDTIQMLVYRLNFANPAADRYSRLALWQVHKTRQDLNAAFKPLNVGSLHDILVVRRGASERPLSTEIVGSNGRRTVRALRLRTLLGLRDSLFSFDIERNAQGEVLGISFYGRGWGHGVGMCQVGAYGMALDGAGYEDILRKYYKGIDLKKLY